MGYLDDLRKRADAVAGQRRDDDEAFRRNAGATETACRNAFQYWLDLARQLNLLRPRVPTRYTLDSRHVLDTTTVPGFHFDEFRVDSRLKMLRDYEVHDHVVIACWTRGAGKLTIAKNFPPEAQRLEARLAQAGIQPTLEPVRDPESGRFVETRYAFDADVHVMVRMVPDHEQGRVKFDATNLEGLKTLVVEYPAVEVNDTLLDELSKWWLGDPSRFVTSGRIARIVEPR